MNKTPSFKLKIINGNSADHIRISQSDAERIYSKKLLDTQMQMMASESNPYGVFTEAEIEITPTMWLCIETIKKENP